MLEIPSVFFLLQDFIDIGVDSFTVGLNDLTMLLLGTFRGSEFHDPTHEAVLRCITEAEKIIHKNSKEFNIAGYIDNKLFPKVLGYPSENNLPDINLVSEIKADTKRRIKDYYQVKS